MSNKDIFIKLSKSIIITYLVLCIVVIGVLSTVLFKDFNSLYFEFLLKIVSIYTIELIIFISAIAIPFQYVRRIKIGNMIKNKKPTKEILYLNFITKVIYLMVFIIIINLCINQYKETENLYTETLKQWEDVEDYYCVPYLYNTPDDLRESSDFWTNLKNIYLEFNSEGGILANFKEYSSNDSEDVSGDFDGPMAVINPNYLKKYSVYDMNNNKIEIDESEEEYLVIIPEKYKDKENKIIDYIKFQNNGVNDEKYANKPIKIIWMKNNQSVFSFSMGINLEDNNSIVDPIMIVLTNNNGTGYMYDCVLGISGSPFKIKIPEGEDPKAYIRNKVDKHSYSKYINKISKANGTMLGKTDNIKDVIKYLAITILTLGSIIILIIFQCVYNFFEQSKEKIIIRKLHGYRWIDKYREYLTLLLFSWFIIISSLLFSNLIPTKRVIIISISCIIVEILFTGIAFYIISNKRIVQVIKGAE